MFVYVIMHTHKLSSSFYILLHLRALDGVDSRSASVYKYAFMFVGLKTDGLNSSFVLGISTSQLRS